MSENRNQFSQVSEYQLTPDFISMLSKPISVGTGGNLLRIIVKAYSYNAGNAMQSEKWDDALGDLDKAEAELERLRNQSPDLETSKLIMEEHFITYEYKVICLMKLNRKMDALTAAEKGKARSLNDLLQQ